MFRYDSSRLGRFLTPDPIAGSIADPQSLNRYGHVRNDPVNLVDPLGLRCTIFWNFEYRRATDDVPRGDPPRPAGWYFVDVFALCSSSLRPRPDDRLGVDLRDLPKKTKKERLAECNTPEGTAEVWKQLASSGLKEQGLDRFLKEPPSVNPGEPLARVQFTSNINSQIPETAPQFPEGSYRFPGAPSMNLHASTDGRSATVEFDRFNAAQKDDLVEILSGPFMHLFAEVIPHAVLGTSTNPCKIREQLIQQGRFTR